MSVKVYGCNPVAIEVDDVDKALRAQVEARK
jgi:hypothetical protein